MRRGILVLAAIFCFFALVACGGGESGKYADVEKALKSATSATEDFVKAMDKAGDGKAVAKAIEQYGKAMNNFSEVLEKHPELEDMENPPEEIKDAFTKFEEASESSLDAMSKIMEYMLDEDVMKAAEALNF